MCGKILPHCANGGKNVIGVVTSQELDTGWFSCWGQEGTEQKWSALGYRSEVEMRGKGKGSRGPAEWQKVLSHRPSGEVSVLFLLLDAVSLVWSLVYSPAFLSSVYWALILCQACARGWELNGEQNRWSPWPHGAESTLFILKQVWTQLMNWESWTASFMQPQGPM